MMAMTNAPKTGPVPALERALAILEKLAHSRQGLTLSQLSRYLELPKSSVHCLLLTFERCGYLNRDSHSGRYRLGLRICDLASAALRNVEIREAAAPLLRQLHERTGLTVHLAILEHGEAVVVEKIEPPGVSTQVSTWLGKSMDLHCTAAGKALAAYLTEEQLDEQIRVRGLLRHNDNTICTPRKLKLDLGFIRERGYSLDDEEEEIGVRCVGAPILNTSGEAVASLSVAGRTTIIDTANLQRLAAEVVATARAVSARVAQQEEQQRPAEAGRMPGPESPLAAGQAAGGASLS
ncbi:MAG: IclR family transcriptional regulator [Bryobacteraceae bacterium]|nr:IclR family transcriptional regulator [Bryobacteraceae bacterium]